MKNPFGNMGNILKQAQAMQAQMAKVQEQARVEDRDRDVRRWQCDGHRQWRYAACRYRHRSRSGEKRRRGNGARFGHGRVERCPQEGSRDDGG